MNHTTPIIFSANSEVAHAAFLENGFHVEPGLWSPDECRILLEASHQLPSFVDGSFRAQMHPHLLVPLFREAMANPNLVGIVERLVGGRASALQTQLFFGAPGTLGFSLHQDNFFVQAKPEVFVSAWSALEDIGPENGGLIVYPGSHKEGLAQVRELPPIEMGVPTHDPNANKTEALFSGTYPELHLRVNRGDVVFLHANLFHASNRNRATDRFRHVLLSTYIRRNEAFRPGAYSQREEIPV